LRTSARTEIGARLTAYPKDECSYRRTKYTEEDVEKQRRSSARSQYPPCQVLLEGAAVDEVGVGGVQVTPGLLEPAHHVAGILAPARGGAGLHLWVVLDIYWPVLRVLHSSRFQVNLTAAHNVPVSSIYTHRILLCGLATHFRFSSPQ